MVRNCPQGNKSNTNKPPGTSNFNIEYKVEDDVEVLESIPLGMVELERQKVAFNWRANYPDCRD
jgi:hypothetical protein